MQKQFMRYVIVGLCSNGVLYLGYLLLTDWGLGYKTAMTLLYIVGTLQTFLLNRRWTFGLRGNTRKYLIRYVLIYLLGFVINFSGLYVFVDLIGFQHEIVQAIFIIVVALILFTLQKIWVFNRLL